MAKAVVMFIKWVSFVSLVPIGEKSFKKEALKIYTKKV